MKQNKTIDILIPAYNAEKYIKTCLDSLLSQTYKDIRIVIAEDGSKDNTLKLLTKYAKKHKNICKISKNSNIVQKNSNNTSFTELWKVLK